jgi:protein involved in polysaccharide export with SLBB domain
VKVSLGQIRSIRVNVLGEVLTPGTYTLPSLATLFNALYLAGGVSDIGSLRNIRLIRNNREEAVLDAYDYLIRGRTEANVRLEDNDMIIVPTYDALVWPVGQVKREMGYEMKSGETVANLLEYAGGFRGDAYTDDLLVKRQAGSRYQVFTVDRDDYPAFTLQDGDSVKVGRIIDLYENRLQISGAVWRPGEYEYSPQLSTLSALIAKAGSLTGSQYADRGQITRRQSDFTDMILPFNVRDIVLGTMDIPLQPDDRVYIPTLDEMTEKYYILVHGEVNKPDTILFRYNMNIEDAILLAGGLKESASMANVEVSRRIRDPRSVAYSSWIAQTFTFPISEALALTDEGSRFTLSPFDEVYVRRSPAYLPQQRVMIGGEILFDGYYAFSRAGERLTDVVEKAGGVTPEAYVRGASLVRKMTDDERAKVQAKLAIASANFGRDSLELDEKDFADTYSVGIDLEKALRDPGGPDDIVLRDGDAIYIPKLNNTVKISGSVLLANTVTFDGKIDIHAYINQAGGYTDNARHRPFIVYMNGKVAATRSGFLYRRYPKVEPGCEIIVPERVVRGNRMGVAEWLSVASSTAAISAMISTMVR